MSWAENDRQRPHHDYDIWHLAKKFAIEMYRITAEFPKEEKYGLVSQLRRAAVSVPSNIAEGSARDTDPQFLRFLHDARGSLAEIDTQLEIAGNLGMLKGVEVSEARTTFDKLSRGLQSLIASIKADIDG